MDPGAVIETFSTAVEAQLCRAALEAAGIEAWVMGDNLAGAHPALGMAIGVRVMVAPVDEAAARSVIAALQGGAARKDRKDDGPEAA
jgi:hypothetical protein